ncbi:lysozyme inhibitor LprI family protein [Bosea lathyri]|uniref:Lysozyme inhibitor LprI-like N-terminal domain-containing protein n=1 Tax=Bosea lathyri TaxID=1036778 RepID=A0A1H5Y9G9_9HYPH|nr:lysozyme inhibitor LprI family protein [Bosea lathyri]SEG20415.1 Protein of unknown function [Bosea lathyri]
MTSLWPAIALLLVFAATPLRAQAPAPPANATLASDRAQLANCLRENRTATQSCIGSIAVACVSATGVDRRAAEQGCARREEAVWRERLMQALQLTGRPLDAGRRSRLAALHVAWEGFIAQKCAFYGSGQQGGLQAGRQAGCELREVAKRALELESAMAQVQAPTRRPQSPPQIIR